MIDLHIHSCYSDDGELKVADLLERGRQAGLSLLSVCDHNCVRANDEAPAAAKVLGLDYIRGVELDCVYQGLNFHVLGYGIQDARGDFAAVEADIDRQYCDQSMEALQKTRALGFEISEDEMHRASEWNFWQGHWTGERFAEVLLARPEYRDHPLLAPYRPGGARGDNPCVNFYWDYYSQGKPCYVEMHFPPMQQTVELIRDNGGAVVLAHPGNNLRGREELLDGILNLGFSGVEAFSSYHTPQQSAYFCRCTRETGLFCTCGSDFHGRMKPAIQLGRMAFPAGIERSEIEAECIAALEDYME